ncbi:MAG TPA: hypothetical protein DCQ93_02885 [Bacteroidetes bacterium]|nr:hypothetical protein [Bacteroidota bacterium]
MSKLFTTLLILTGVTAGYLYWQYKRLYDYLFKLNKVSLGSIDRNGFSIILEYTITNKSVYGVTIENYNFDIYINGIYVGKVNSVSKFDINSFGTSPLTLSVYVPFKLDAKLLTLLPLLKTDISRVIFELRGTMSAKALGFSVAKIPVTYSTDLKSLIIQEN